MNVSIGDFLAQVLGILGVNSEKQQQMIQEVEGVIQLTLLDHLLGKLDSGEQVRLKQKLADKQSEQQREVLREYFSVRHDPDDMKQKYMEIAMQDIIPDYTKTLLQSATPEQREEVKKLLQSF